MAFMMVNVELGEGRKVLSLLKEIQEIKEAYLIYGAWDIIVRIEALTRNDLNTTIAKIRKEVADVSATLTMIIM